MAAALRIAPSILSADFARLGEQMAAAEQGGADLFHLDVMDGQFVPNLTIGPPVIKSLRPLTNLPFDAHLMVQDPERFVYEFVTSGCNSITVHAEASTHLHRTVNQIREAGAKAGVALNPSTPLSMLEHIIDDIDMIVIMTVNPGFSGQRFIPSVIPKIVGAKKLIGSRTIELEIDGGVGPETVKACVDAGATIVVAGNAAFRGKGNIAENLAAIRRAGAG